VHKRSQHCFGGTASLKSVIAARSDCVQHSFVCLALICLEPSSSPSPPPLCSGCGQHSPIAQQQQRVLRRRLQQLRANNAADKQQQPAASSSSGSSGAVSPQELRIAPVYDLSGVGPRDAQRIEQQLVPAAIKVLQKYIKVCGCSQICTLNM